MRKFLFILFLSFHAFGFSQESSEKPKVYTSLKEALKQPLEVEAFKLKGKYKVIPKEIFELKNLRKLDLSKTNILFIPEEIKELTQLEFLSLKKTNLGNFPVEILELYNLKFLNLSHTDIVYLPEEINKLYALSELDISATEISGLPQSMTLMNELSRIDMRLIDINKQGQDEIREQFPGVEVYFSSPCNCK